MSNDKLREALAIVEKYGMKGDVIYKEIEALAASKPEPQAQAEPEVPPHLDVRRIMLRIVPGFDGEGEEVYATTVDEVVELLSEMGLWSEAIAKKDAALDACVEARNRLAEKETELLHKWEVLEELDAAITKAEEARK